MNEPKIQKSIPKQILRGAIFTLTALITIFVLLVFIIPTVLDILAGKGTALVDDSDMQLQTINIPEDKNMFYDLEKIADIINTDLIDKNFEEIITDKYWDEEIISATISQNEKVFELRDRALSKKSYQSPVSANPEKISFENFNKTNHYRKLTRLTIVKALWLSKNGQTELAFEEIFKNIIIADAIEKSQCDLLLFLVAMSSKDISLDAFEIIKKSDTDDRISSKYRSKLSDYKVYENEAIFKNEYLVRKKYVFAYSEGRYSDDFGGGSFLDKQIVKNKFYFDPAIDVNKDYQLYSEFIKNFHSTCELKADTNLDEREDRGSPLNMVKLYFTKNAVNKVLYTFPDSAYRSLIEKKCKLNERIDKLSRE